MRQQNLGRHPSSQREGLAVSHWLEVPDITLCHLTYKADALGLYPMANPGCQLDYIWNQLNPKLLGFLHQIIWSRKTHTDKDMEGGNIAFVRLPSHSLAGLSSCCSRYQIHLRQGPNRD